jgi:L-threonylcarbamoyladenylate synthase
MPIHRHLSPDRPAREALDAAAAVLGRGGLVVFPTDTLYGIAVDPWNHDAVSRLFAAKGRPARLAVPLIAADRAQVIAWVGMLGPAGERLADAWWPGPLTLVLDARADLDPALLGGGTTVAVRVPAHAVAAGLAGALGRPVTATSANPTGGPAPARTADLDPALATAVDLVLDAGPCAGGAASTIVDVRSGAPVLVRAGAVPWERVVESLR